MNYELEDLDLHPSKIIDQALLQIGEILADALLESKRYDETAVLDELAGALNYAASCYGEKTGQIREDLGVSLSEAAIMRLESFRKNDLVTTADNEWRYFALDAQQTIKDEIAYKKIESYRPQHPSRDHNS